MIEGSDAGGRRWFLDDRPVHAGTGLELLCESNRRPCPDCGDGCPSCDERGFLFDPLWLRVRAEFDYHRGCALLYLPTVGSWDTCCEAKPGLRFRWPARDR